jgi:hypothetical protein
VSELEETVESRAPDCDCEKVLFGLTECRQTLKTLSSEEQLAVLCALAPEHGLSVVPDHTEADDGGVCLVAPENLDWAREFVSQVVLSDALMGAALRLDESKQQIDFIAERLERVTGTPDASGGEPSETAPPARAPMSGEQAYVALAQAYRKTISPPVAALCGHVQRLLESARTGGADAEIALAISEEAARLAEATITLGESPSDEQQPRSK